MKNIALAAIAAATALAAPAASAQVTVLDFEGIGDNNAVGNFYQAQGFTFSADALALVDSDAGGSGNFANEPSASTIMFFTDSNQAILNANNGFTTGFSFFYTSSVATTVNVFDGLNGTGNVLATLNLAAQFNSNCAGDPNGSFCNWTAVGATFGGIGRSVSFAGAAGQTGFDDITFGSAIAGGGVPEPATWALMILGFGAVGGALRRKQKASVRFA